MSWTGLENTINAAWEARDTISVSTTGEVRDAVRETLLALDGGEFRVAEKVSGEWHTHQWIKKAVLLSFRLNPMEPIAGSPGNGHWYDKVPSKFATGRMPTSRAPAFAPCRARSCVTRPISARAPCSCPAS
jgi:2,3,4,5-tetrahydropyridine-2-carboxylate N-succinyltransferase